MDLLQPWVISLVVLATLDWKLTATFLDRYFWPRFGWENGDFRKVQVRVTSELTRWAIIAGLCFGSLYVLPYKTYLGLALWLLVIALVNILTYTVYGIKYFRKYKDIEGTGNQLALYNCYRIFSFVLVLAGALAPTCISAYQENVYIRNQTIVIVVETDGDLCTKKVSPKYVGKLILDSNTWFEISANGEPGVVYRVKANNQDNSTLLGLAGKHHTAMRDKLITLQWNTKNGQIDAYLSEDNESRQITAILLANNTK